MLQEIGSEVVAVNNGADALRFLSFDENINVAIIDKQMPNMDGITLFREIKKIRPDMKVIISSGYTQEKEMNKLKEEGLFGYIPKPFKLDDLISMLKKV